MNLGCARASRMPHKADPCPIAADTDMTLSPVITCRGVHKERMTSLPVYIDPLSNENQKFFGVAFERLAIIKEVESCTREQTGRMGSTSRHYTLSLNIGGVRGRKKRRRAAHRHLPSRAYTPHRRRCGACSLASW